MHYETEILKKPIPGVEKFTTLIQALARPHKYIDKYVLRLKFMSGDGDAYRTEELAGEQSEIAPAVTFLTALATRYKDQPWGDWRRLDQVWNDLPCAFVIHDNSDAPPKPGWLIDFASIDWPGDSTCDEYFASLQDWALTYYDSEGREHLVSVDIDFEVDK